jgi:RNA polymerase sigma factor for flagellar operon FliA
MTTSARAAAAADSPEVRARVEEGLSLVDIIARQMVRQLPGSVELDELISLGREGLLSAAQTFDPSLGVPFRRWANIRVRGAILDGVRATARLPRRLHKRLQAFEAGDRVAEAMHEEDAALPPADPERADERLGVYLSGIATGMAMGLIGAHEEAEEPDDKGASPEELLARRQLFAQIRELMTKLPDAERQLLERHYFGGTNFDEVAKDLGLSKSWASRLHARGIEAITRGLRRTRTIR